MEDNKLKIFLVEDEAIIRKGIKNNISWEKEGFLFSGEASDGELAYPLIKKIKPDIVITDIRMPFMDGLELCGLIREELPETKLIILSGYGEFNYAEQAISNGVTEYLLKPINSEKLMKSIREVGEKIRQEQARRNLIEEYQEEQRTREDSQKTHFFQDIVSGRLSTTEILKRGKNWSMDFTASGYTVILLKITYLDNLLEYSSSDTILNQNIKEYAQGEQNLLIFDRGESEGLGLILRTECEQEVRPGVQKLGEMLEKMVETNQGVQYFVSVGETVTRLGEIGNSFQSAGRAFARRFYTDANTLIFEKDLDTLGMKETLSLDLGQIDGSQINRRQVEDFLNSGWKEDVDQFVEEYFQNISEDNYNSFIFCNYILVDIHFCATHFLEGIGILASELPRECRHLEAVTFKTATGEMIKEYSKRLLHESIKLRDQNSNNKYASLLNQAKAYIGENFQNNEITLNEVAAFVNTSPSYFSTIFRQETGMTFIEYLTSVRLRKAKELLMCTAMRTAEVGYTVGYKDSHYFSYIFKKICGCTPKVYRTREREVQS